MCVLIPSNLLATSPKLSGGAARRVQGQQESSLYSSFDVFTAFALRHVCLREPRAEAVDIYLRPFRSFSQGTIQYRHIPIHRHFGHVIRCVSLRPSPLLPCPIHNIVPVRLHEVVQLFFSQVLPVG